VREVLQVIGQLRGAVELDQSTDERTHDDVQFDELVHVKMLLLALFGLKRSFYRDNTILCAPNLLRREFTGSLLSRKSPQMLSTSR
jgi:hypothetical protein